VDLEQDALDRTGVGFHIRPIRADDAPSLVAFHERLSPQSSYLRYFTSHEHLSEQEVHHLTEVDYVDRLALVAMRDGRIIGVARFDRAEGHADAEVAFVVADECQHHGIGGTLLQALAAAARRLGVDRFNAQVLPANTPMLSVFAESGYAVEQSQSGGVVDVVIRIGAQPG